MKLIKETCKRREGFVCKSYKFATINGIDDMISLTEAFCASGMQFVSVGIREDGDRYEGVMNVLYTDFDLLKSKRDKFYGMDIESYDMVFDSNGDIVIAGIRLRYCEMNVRYNERAFKDNAKKVDKYIQSM